MICDAHCHFFSSSFFRTLGRDVASPASGDAADTLPARLGWDPPGEDTTLADRWIAELDKHQVARAMLIASVPGDEQAVAAAVSRHPSRFVGAFMFAFHLIALGAVIGVPAALLAALFLATVHELQHWLWQDLPERLDASGPPWYLVLGLPAAGACVVLLARTLLPGDGGHGPLGGISVEPTPLGTSSRRAR